MQETLKASFIANMESLSIDLATDKLRHVTVATPDSNGSISLWTEWRSRPSQRIWCGCAFGSNTSAMFWIFPGAVGQVTKPRASGSHDTCDLFPHLAVRFLVIGAVIPMDKAVEIGQITNIKALPCDLPSYEE